jgi:hypothetical protein
MAAVAFWRAGLMVKMVVMRIGLLKHHQIEMEKEA